MARTFDPQLTFRHEYVSETRRRLRKWLLIYLWIMVLLQFVITAVIAGLTLGSPDMQTMFSWWFQASVVVFIAAITIIYVKPHERIDRRHQTHNNDARRIGP